MSGAPTPRPKPRPRTKPSQSERELLAFDDDEEDLTATWMAKGIDPTDVEFSGSTMTPSGWANTSAQTNARTEKTLPPESASIGEPEPQISEDASELLLGDVIGRGGTGVVYLANQPALSRRVAVKVLTEPDEKARTWLLREARVTGSLEHPNIVPIHDIGELDAGTPMIVMKRIEGRGWDRILQEERQAALREDKDKSSDGRERHDAFFAFLERHLRILVQIARAAHFAHSKNVLHRDIKPENVMLGNFGEVYLVDWDLAAALEGCEVPGLPDVRLIDDLFGTPGYMAPEMVSCEGKHFGVTTDVFLLGSTLAEILNGRAPFKDPDLVTSLTKSFQCEAPSFDDVIPQSLREICLDAMSRSPAMRTPTASDVADELETFLTRRHSLTLTAEGNQRLDELMALLDDKDPEFAASEAASLYRECRFSFEQALRIWEENPEANVGLSRAAERMVAFELSAGRPDAARALLDDLQDPHPLLEQQVEQALMKRRMSDARLASIAHDRDVRVGQLSRSRGAAILSIISVALNLVCGQLDRHVLDIQHKEYLIAQVINFGFALLVVAVLRKSVWSTTANKQITKTSITTYVSYIAVISMCWALGLRFEVALAFMCFSLGLIWVIGTTTFDPRMATLPVVAFGEIPLLLHFPDWAFEILAGAIGLGLVGTAVLLRVIPAPKEGASRG